MKQVKTLNIDGIKIKFHFDKILELLIIENTAQEKLYAERMPPSRVDSFIKEFHEKGEQWGVEFTLTKMGSCSISDSELFIYD